MVTVDPVGHHSAADAGDGEVKWVDLHIVLGSERVTPDCAGGDCADLSESRQEDLRPSDLTLVVLIETDGCDLGLPIPSQVSEFVLDHLGAPGDGPLLDRLGVWVIGSQ